MADDGMHLVLLLLALLVFSSSAKVFLSIDCGASETYTDENMIKWTTDDGYINSGKSQMVPSYNSVSQVMDTLRVFTTGKKNCYSIKVDKGEKVLVRASFYYANYDDKLDPPTFDLQLNGIYWATVKNDDIVGAYEGIYVVEEGDISVCLVQTFDGQFPFISALEVRSLDANMYSRVDANRALYLIERTFASEDQSLSYPDDIYDRVWNPTSLTPTISNDALTIDVNNATDNPPEAALRNAVTSSLTTFPIVFSIDQLPITKVPVYVNMYFAELDTLDSTDERSFDVYIGDTLLTSTPITPPYGRAMELTFANISASSITVFSLIATSSSTMPPIINAFEVFVFGSNSSNNNNNNNGNDDSGTGTSTGTGTGTGTGNGNDSNNNNGSDDSSNSSRRSRKKSNKLPTLVGSTFSIFLVIWAIAGFILIYHYKRKSAIARGQTDGGVMPNETPDSTQHIMANGQY